MEPGDRIGRWEVVERLGAGGTAEVYRRRDGPDEAAIKLLRASVEDDEHVRRRLAREAEILQRLDHPSVVRVRHVDLDAVPARIEMELVTGRHCGQLVRTGPASVRTVVEVGTQLLDAMACWHAHGIAHRDVKPANVIVGPGRRVVVVDFGLALDPSLERLSGLGVRVGTCAYAPPEWLADDASPPAAWDVYGAGQILCELLVGRRMFDVGLPATALMAAKASVAALDPGPRVPAALRAVVCRLTATEPAERPADGGTARQAFALARVALRI